jgi:glyoxylase-like metal-dependent hydrolase (beta-lactamase superfamily II)
MPKLHSIGERFGRVHCYLLDDDQGLTIIDALGNVYAKTIVEYLDKLNRRPAEIQRIILTHAHLTHVKGAAALKRASGAHVWAPQAEQDVIEGRRPSNQTTWIPKRPFRVLPQQYLLNLSNVLWHFGLHPDALSFPPVYIDHVIDQDDQKIGPVITLKTPGHTPGSTSFYWPEMETFFAGDAVVTWPRFELGWKGLTENFSQNVRSVQRVVDVFENRGWKIKTFATGHGPHRPTADGVADLKELLRQANLR